MPTRHSATAFPCCASSSCAEGDASERWPAPPSTTGGGCGSGDVDDPPDDRSVEEPGVAQRAGHEADCAVRRAVRHRYLECVRARAHRAGDVVQVTWPRTRAHVGLADAHGRDVTNAAEVQEDADP